MVVVARSVQHADGLLVALPAGDGDVLLEVGGEFRRVGGDNRATDHLLDARAASQHRRRADGWFDATYSGVRLLSRIGDRVAEPWATEVTTTGGDDAVRDVVTDELDRVETLTEDLIEGRVDVF